MHDLLSELFGWLLHLLGLSVEEAGERAQAIAFFAFCTIFGIVAGCLLSELASTLLFIVAGFCGVACVLVAYGVLG